MISRQDIDKVKDRADISDIITRYGITLTRSGTSLKGLCPFHEEGTPSFHVNPHSNTFHCFGCGVGGDVFEFLNLKEGFTFSEAVKYVAEIVNVDIQENVSKEEKEAGSKKKRLLEVMQATAKFFASSYHPLPDGHPAKQELIKRNLSHVQDRPHWLQEFGIGYAPANKDTLHQHLNDLGYSETEQIEAGLIRRTDDGRTFDVFRGRLTWEIRDVNGRPIGFGARKLMESDKLGKYLNSSQTLLYDKSRTLYGLDLARPSAVKKKQIIVVEGYTDVMAMAAVGHENVVASSGTAFGAGQIQIIRRLLGDDGELVFLFDSDAPGRKAARSTFEIENLPHSQSFVGKQSVFKKDPCDIRLHEGDEALYNSVIKENLVPITEFVIQDELGNHDIALAEGRSLFLNKIVPVLNNIKDFSLQEDYVRKVSFWSGSSINTVKTLMREQGSNQGGTVISRGNDEESVAPVKVSNGTKQQESVLALMLQYPLEAFYTLSKIDLDEKPFDSDLQILYIEIWETLKNTQGKVEHLYPDNFSDPKIVLRLLHKEFIVLNTVSDTARASMVERILTASAKAVKDIHRRALNDDLQARLYQAYSADGNINNDLSVLQEIYDQQDLLKK